MSEGVANFKKSLIFTLKLHDLAISEKKKFGRREPAKIFLGGQIFKKKILKKNSSSVKKSKIRRGGQKALLEGVGSI